MAAAQNLIFDDYTFETSPPAMRLAVLEYFLLNLGLSQPQIDGPVADDIQRIEGILDELFAYQYTGDPRHVRAKKIQPLFTVTDAYNFMWAYGYYDYADFAELALYLHPMIAASDDKFGMLDIMDDMTRLYYGTPDLEPEDFRAAMSGLYTSCLVFWDFQPPRENTFRATASKTNIAQAGETITVTISTDAGCAWSLETLPAGVTSSVMAGTGSRTINVQVAANGNVVEKTMNLIFNYSSRGTALDKSYSLKLRQEGAPAFSFNPSTNKLSLPMYAGKYCFSVTPALDNQLWQKTTNYLGGRWLTTTLDLPRTGSRSIEFTIEKNDTGQTRTTTIGFYYEGQYETTYMEFEIEQRADKGTFYPDIDEIVALPDGGLYYVNFPNGGYGWDCEQSPESGHVTWKRYLFNYRMEVSFRGLIYNQYLAPGTIKIRKEYVMSSTEPWPGISLGDSESTTDQDSSDPPITLRGYDDYKYYTEIEIPYRQKMRTN